MDNTFQLLIVKHIPLYRAAQVSANAHETLKTAKSGSSPLMLEFFNILTKNQTIPEIQLSPLLLLYSDNEYCKGSPELQLKFQLPFSSAILLRSVLPCIRQQTPLSLQDQACQTFSPKWI